MKNKSKIGYVLLINIIIQIILFFVVGLSEDVPALIGII